MEITARSWRTRVPLQVKLVLSYLGVALGAILLLVIVVSLAVQNYFFTVQQNQLRSQAEYFAQQIGELYRERGRSWDNIGAIRTYNPELFVVIDTNQQLHNAPPPLFIRLSDADVPTLRQALLQALQGQEVQGSLQGAPNDSSVFSGFYISVPLRDGGQPGGQIIGAMLLAQPDQYPRGFSPYEFLANVDQAILIAGGIIAVIVVIFSLMLARSLTRPLKSLTLAAEQMKAGNYAQRVPEPNSHDELGKLAATFNDMADRIESDVTELRRQEQMRRDMIANIAHDLVTPLTAIQGFSEALADNVISKPKARQETAQLIGREVQRLRRLVSDMQQMTALESGHVQLDLAPLDLHALVDELLAVIGPECEQAGIALYNEIAPTTPLVLADSDHITQVLLNLLDNARRHTPSGGSITVGASLEAARHETAEARAVALRADGPRTRPPSLTASRKDENRLASTGCTGCLTVWISDTGTGIDPADLPHIFDRFYRADRARSGTNGGSGLGLSIVRAIITAHEGTIKAESTPGQGTRISFTLPLAAGNHL